jgi:hypothetical protein
VLFPLLILPNGHYKATMLYSCHSLNSKQDISNIMKKLYQLLLLSSLVLPLSLAAEDEVGITPDKMSITVKHEGKEV